jgi:hypothetical protein
MNSITDDLINIEITQSKESAAINTLVSKSEVVEVDAPVIKVSYTIEVRETEAWAKLVMTSFILHLPSLAKYIRVKSWAKLTIGQMADYLAKLATDEDIMIQGLLYREVEK